MPATLICGACLWSGSGIESEYLAFDDLGPESAVQQNTRFVEEVYGGAIPLAVYVEPSGRRVALLTADDALAEEIEEGVGESLLDHALERAPDAATLRRRLGLSGEVSAPAPEGLPHALLLGLDEATAGGYRLLDDLMLSTHAAGIPVSTVEDWHALVDTVFDECGSAAWQAIHANDCIAPLGSHTDRHAWIGEGTIGDDGFRAMLATIAIDHVPAITEMPGEIPEKDSVNISRLKALRDTL